MNKVIVLCMLLLSFVIVFLWAQKGGSEFSYAERWEKVEQLAKKSLPESALKEVESILSQAKKEKNTEQTVKAMIYKMKFTVDRNPDEQERLIEEFEQFSLETKDVRMKSLLCSMTAEMYLSYYQKDAYKINQRTEVLHYLPTDMKEWTKNHFFEKINSLLRLSTLSEVELKRTNPTHYSTLIQKGIDSRWLQPTLYDFLIARKIQLLESFSAQQATQQFYNKELFVEAAEFIKLKFDTIENKSILKEILRSYQELLAFRLQKNNLAALVLTDLNRLNFARKICDWEGVDSLYLNYLNQLAVKYSKEPVIVEVVAAKANWYLEESAVHDSKKYYKRIAYDLCEDAIDRFPHYPRIGILKNILKNIKQKQLTVLNNEYFLSSSDIKLNVSSLNLKSIRVELYRVKASSLSYWAFKQDRENESYPNRTLLSSRVVTLAQDDNFQQVDTMLFLPPCHYGIYEVSVKEEVESGSNSASAANSSFIVSDLSYISRTTNPSSQSIYVLNRGTGIPQPGVTVEDYETKWMGSMYENKKVNTFITDNDGLCKLPFFTNYRNQLIHLKQGKDEFFIASGGTYFQKNENRELENQVKLSLLTDRAIYRPGQTVIFKGIAYVVSKKTQEVVANESFELSFRDANYQEVTRMQFITNTFGSFSGQFVIPQGGINGMYHIQSANGIQSFRVEEYKRPSFEVKLEKPLQQVRLGEAVQLAGSVKAFAGYPIANASIKYRVVKSAHRYCWWLRESDEQVTNGVVESDSEGNFSIRFITKDSNRKNIPFRGMAFSYTVYVDVTDAKGETQTAEQTVSAGSQSMFIIANVPEKLDKDKKNEFDVYTETVNGEKISTDIHYKLYRLQPRLTYQENTDKEKKMEVAELVMEGKHTTSFSKLKLALQTLPSAEYKLVLSTKDAYGGEVFTEAIFVLYGHQDQSPPVKSYVWLLTEQTECEVGEVGIIHFGTSTQNTKVLYEIMKGNVVIESKWMHFSNEIKRFEIPFQESYGNGVNVMFTFMKDEKLFTEKVTLKRRVQEKKLSPTLSVFRDKLQPGEKAEWTVSIPECATNERKAELLIGMYDASLDTFQSLSWDFVPRYVKGIDYSPEWDMHYMEEKYGNCDFPQSYAEVADFQLDRTNWFGFDFRDDGFDGIRRRVKGKFVPPVLKKDEEEVPVFAMSSLSRNKSETDISDDFKKESSRVRTNFNETSFFYPHLQTDVDGKVYIRFTAPESLTRWNVKMLAHTPDLFYGQSEAQVITQKELMVQMNLPRFVRSSDSLVLAANVTNLTDEKQIVQVKFEMLNPTNQTPIKLNESGVREVTIAPHQTQSVEWVLDEFKAYDLVVCKVVAQSDNFSDGEQKYLPILPDKVLLTESMTMSVRANEKRIFSFENLKTKWADVEMKKLSLEFSTNPIWYAVQAFPTLALPASENALDYLCAYYTNTLASYIVQSYPKIGSVFEQLKNLGNDRDVLLSNLEKNSELKNVLLQESPWLMEAKDETEQKRRIAFLFDLNNQKCQAQQYLEKLQSYQLPQGGFAWFPGMPESRYITQEILLSLARLEAITSTSSLSKEMLQKAINYLDNQMVLDYMELKKNDPSYRKHRTINNEQLFYLYMRSSYSQFSMEDSLQTAVDYYVNQAQTYWAEFTLYQQAQTALVLHRRGESKNAKELIASLTEKAFKTDELGMFWARNTSGYYWSERPVVVQTTLMEAFAEVTGDRKLLEEMKLWLLKQKQTQCWDSSVASINAIYALLHYGEDWLNESGHLAIELDNQLLSHTATEEVGSSYFKISLPVDKKTSGEVNVTHQGKGVAWGAMYWQYLQELDKVEAQHAKGLMIDKKLFVEKVTSSGKTLLPAWNTLLHKGDKVITRITVTTDRDLEFVALKDLRASCFEPMDVLSGMQWMSGICYYQSSKDASTQFFFTSLPKGTYVFEYASWVNASGSYSSGMTTVQCQYAPEFVSRSASVRVKVMP